MAATNQLLFLMPLATILAYVGALTGRWSSWLLSRSALVTMGGMCYSIYLLHYEVISMTGRISTRFSPGSHFVSRFLVDAAVAIPAVMILSLLFFVAIERPCMNPGWRQLRQGIDSGKCCCRANPRNCRPTSPLREGLTEIPRGYPLVETRGSWPGMAARDGTGTQSQLSHDFLVSRKLRSLCGLPMPASS
jgi:hypothetical protein